MKIELGWFFEDLEGLSDLFEEFPWDPLKKLKEYLCDTINFTLPREIPLDEPLQKGYFLTIEGEVLPLNEVLIKEKGVAEFKGERLEGAILFPGAILRGRKILLKKGAFVEAGAVLAEPALIGEYTEIRHCAYIRGALWAGKGVVIGHTTEVKNSIFFSGAKAPHFAYVGDSIIGKEVNLGAGTKLANLKFTKKEIIIEFEGRKYHTGLRKMGAIIGDYSQTGCNSVLQPGTLLGKRSFVFPGVVPPAGVYPPRTRLK